MVEHSLKILESKKKATIYDALFKQNVFSGTRGHFYKLCKHTVYTYY